MAAGDQIPTIVEMHVTIISLEEGENGTPHPVTQLFRFEFETLADAEGFIDTSEDVPGLIDVEKLGALQQVKG